MGRMYRARVVEFANEFYNEGEIHMNKVTLMGRVGSELALEVVAGNNLTKFSLATTRKWKNKQGEKQEKTEWHRLVAFGKLAEIIGQYLKKGSQAYFEGKLQTRKWQDQQGQDRYTTEVVVDQMQMLGGNPQGGQGQQQGAQNNYAPQG